MGLFVNEKPALRSKTVWAGILTASLPLIPGFNEFVKLHPEAYSVIQGLIIIGLRMLTKGPIQ